MSSYIHFTEEQKEQARQTDLCDLLQRQGEKLKRSGKEYEWRDGSQKVTIRGNLWFHQYERVGGDAIDFVRKYMNKSYPEAMEYLLGGSGMGTLTTAPPVVRESKPFELPPRNDNNRRAYAYLLNKRGINREVLNAFFYTGLIYESADYHNAVFVGKNTEGVAVHAHKRGTGSESTFKGNVDSSDPRYSFHWIGRSNRVYLFEAPIDMLSFISLHRNGWQKHSYAAACGVSDQVLWQILADHPQVDTVYLCHDSDVDGQKAAVRIANKLTEQGINTEILVPIRKDWKLKLFFKWGIEFDEDNPYAVPDHGGREVQYAEKKEIMDGIIKKYHPDWIVKDKPATDGGNGISGQDQAESESHEPQQTPPKKPGDKKGGGGMNPVPPNRRTALKPAQEVKPNEPS